MKVHRVLAVTFAAMLLAQAPATALAADAPCQKSPRGGPADIVRAVYASYPFGSRKAVVNEPRPVLAKYFDARLIELFLADQACRVRERGVCAINFDVLFAAQDGDISELRFCRSCLGPDWVDVRFRNFGKDNVISIWTVGSGSYRRIADLVFDGDRSLVESLSSGP